MAARQRRFLDRLEAGALLAEVVAGLVSPPVLVLGIPRGGVVVAARVAARLGALDVVVPRKVGAPGNPELAVGAVADGVQAIDEPAVRRLGLDMAEVRAEAARQTAEVARRTAAYRQGLPPRPWPAGPPCWSTTGWRPAGPARPPPPTPAGPAPPGSWSPCPSARSAWPSGCGRWSTRWSCWSPRTRTSTSARYERFPQVDDDEVLRCLQEGRPGRAGLAPALPTLDWSSRLQRWRA